MNLYLNNIFYKSKFRIRKINYFITAESLQEMAKGNSDTFDPTVSNLIFHVCMYIEIVVFLEYI
jgi:hypothetical protein